MSELSPEEREAWDVDPDNWPHTPPHRIFRALYEEDDNNWWRAGSGHGMNAYDAALEEIDQLTARVAEAEARIHSYYVAAGYVDEAGMPKCLPIKVNERGEGPLSCAEDGKWVCWCGTGDECSWNRAFAANEAQLREQIAQEIEAGGPPELLSRGVWTRGLVDGLRCAARIARGSTSSHSSPSAGDDHNEKQSGDDDEGGEA